MLKEDKSVVQEEVDETLAKLEEKYGEAFKIEAEYPKETKLVGYYKAPDYSIKKKIFSKMFLDGDQIGAAEIILAECWVAGEHLYTIENIRLECAVHIMQNMDNTFNDSIKLKKSSNQKSGS
jgi:hypothetical protein